MRVLVTTPDLRLPGGVANYFGVLRPHLAQVAEYHTVGPRPAETSSGMSVVRLTADYARFALRLLRGRYDLVHINPSFASRSLPRDAVFLVIAKLFRRRVLVFLRGWDPDCERSVSTRWKRLFRLVYGRADAFVVLGRQYARKLRELGYDGTIECEQTVAGDDAFRAAPAFARQPGTRFRILFLARLEKEKGLYEAIEAYRIVKRRFGFAELVIAGCGSQDERARAYVRERAIADVEFLGHVSGARKTEAFASAQLYIFPSYFEGMPNSVLEAMAHGLPVITSPVGGIGDFFEDARMGFLAPSPDPAVLARLVERLIVDPMLAATMGKNNRAYAERSFTAESAARRLTAIYSRVSSRETELPLNEKAPVSRAAGSPGQVYRES